MRLVRAPLRISIGGGGTDLPFYCEEHGADLTFATIDKYVYITVNETLKNTYQISLEDKHEEKEEMSQISNNYIRSTLKTLNVEKKGLSICSTSDVPSGTGLGSSGSFTVALLKALENFSSKNLSRKELAETAFDIENNKLGKSCGKQDQYAAAFGGLKRLQIKTDSSTKTEELDISKASMKKLEERLMLFYTAEKRYSEEVLKEQKKQVNREDSKKKKMDEIKKIGEEIREKLEKGDISEYGNLLHRHWETKKKFTSKMTNPKIDRMYNEARKNGAKGGKIVGAGGGGFLLLFVEKERQEDVKQAMKTHNPKHMNFKFENRGCETVYEG